MKQELFQNFILSTNKKGSGKANSYMRDLDLLSEMIKEEPKVKATPLYEYNLELQGG